MSSYICCYAEDSAVEAGVAAGDDPSIPAS